MIGKSRMRFPVALKTAFATAAAAPVIPISPIPRAPNGACSLNGPYSFVGGYVLPHCLASSRLPISVTSNNPT